MRIEFPFVYWPAIIRNYRIPGFDIALMIEEFQFAFIGFIKCIDALHKMEYSRLLMPEMGYRCANGNDLTQNTSHLE